MYLKHIILNPAFFENISKYNRFFMCDKIVIAVSFAVFVLNMYWFGIICKGLLKMALGPKTEDPMIKQIDLIRETLGYTSVVEMKV